MTQQEALDVLKMGHNVYLTGAAGSGKTYILNQYIKYLKDHGVAVGITASTGIAATHMGGMTIHAWSGLGIRDTLSEYDLEAMEEKSYLWKRFEKVKVLIIDEVSMLHHFRLDLVNRIAQFFKRNNLPFGGLQVILCGDFFQLPPISRFNEPESRFIYASDSWKAMDLKICYLEEQHRQNDSAFLNVLNAIRNNEVDESIYEILQSRYRKDAIQEKTAANTVHTKLFTHNIDVDKINSIELEKIPGDVKKFGMLDHGSPHLVETLKKSCLAPETLVLKKGARVMFVKNNPDMSYANGTLGTVVSIEGDTPVVETVQGKRILVESVGWTIEEDGKVKAQISQLPLRLAWAITVHKSQGMSLDSVEVDLSKSFEKGMGYVALSRVRTLVGLSLLGLNDVALQVNEEILEFDTELKEYSEDSRKELNKLSPKEKTAKQDEYIQSISPTPAEKHNNAKDKIPSHHETKLLVEKELSLADMAEKRGIKVETIISHIEQLKKENPKGVSIKYLQNSFSEERLAAIKKAFKKSYAKHKDWRLGPVKAALGSDYTYEEIRLARLFLI